MPLSSCAGSANSAPWPPQPDSSATIGMAIDTCSGRTRHSGQECNMTTWIHMGTLPLAATQPCQLKRLLLWLSPKQGATTTACAARVSVSAGSWVYTSRRMKQIRVLAIQRKYVRVNIFICIFYTENTNIIYFISIYIGMWAPPMTNQRKMTIGSDSHIT